MRRFIPIAVISVIAIIVFSLVIFNGESNTTPSDGTELLFDGVQYTRTTIDFPRPNVVHVIRIDLTHPDIRFLVTPNMISDGERIRARTTSAFLEEFGLQLAINGGFFGWSTEHEPEADDIITLHGLTASQGLVYTMGYANPADYDTVYISEDHQVEFNDWTEPIYNAISGYWMFVEAGSYRPVETPPEHANQFHPRTVIALNEAETELIFVLVDGRQPRISEGVTINELAQLVIDAGGYRALNLDGGGSVTLVIEGEDDTAQLLNTPVSADVVGRERPIASHLGIYAERLED